MYTIETGNCQSNYNLRKPMTLTKNMDKPIITDYALILLKVAQEGFKDWGGSYTKKELVALALGHKHDKFKFWGWETNGAMSSTFAAFNYNKLLYYDEHTRKWFHGKDLLKYIKYHFGPYTTIPLQLKNCYDKAVEYNIIATEEWEAKKAKYKEEKRIGKEYFFQE